MDIFFAIVLAIVGGFLNILGLIQARHVTTGMGAAVFNGWDRTKILVVSQFEN